MSTTTPSGPQVRITATNGQILGASNALHNAMQPRQGRSPLPHGVLWALMTTQQALADAGSRFSAARDMLQAEHTKRDESGPVRRTQTERTITGEGTGRTETVREIPTGEFVLVDDVAFARAAQALYEEPVEVEVRQVALSAVLEAGWEPVLLWPLIGLVLTEPDPMAAESCAS